MSNPTAAPAHWRYLDHRTVEDLEAPVPIRRIGSDVKRDRALGIPIDSGRGGAQFRSSLPDRPCPRCGARGWCGHGDRIAA